MRSGCLLVLLSCGEIAHVFVLTVRLPTCLFLHLRVAKAAGLVTPPPRFAACTSRELEPLAPLLAAGDAAARGPASAAHRPLAARCLHRGRRAARRGRPRWPGGGVARSTEAD